MTETTRARLTVIKRLVYRSFHCVHGPFAFQAPSFIKGTYMMDINEIVQIIINFVSALSDCNLLVIFVTRIKK